jgi:DtxR family Mn-dependent transcriptional regulator
MEGPLLSLLAMGFIAGALYWLFRPERGAYWRWKRGRQMTAQVLREDALKHIHRCERYGRQASLESLAGAIQITPDQTAKLLSELEEHDLVHFEGDSFGLTARGVDYALHIIRAHRLWERYLADETGFAQEVWHDQAERAEHSLSPRAADALAAELGNPTHDPHGDPIPTPAGEMVPHGGQPLTTIAPNQVGRIVHLEDEPEATYAQIAAEGLHVGMDIRLLEVSPHRIRFWANGDEHLLAPIVAANISVLPLVAVDRVEEEVGIRLSELPVGQQAEVVSISQGSRGVERRRFLDLGILPGTVVAPEFVSPSGDPTAYRIRDALIALRREQADQIRVRVHERTPEAEL